jgi:hypothetical protein
MNNVGHARVPKQTQQGDDVMTFQDDPNRPRPSNDDPPVYSSPAPEAPGRFTSDWSIPLAIAGVALIVGLLIFSLSGDRTSLVAETNEPSSVVRPAPTPNVTPPPTTPPAKTQ